MPARQLRNYSVQVRCSWGRGGLEETRASGREGTEVEEQWDLEPSLIHSPQIPEVGQGTLTPVLLSTHRGHQAQAMQKPGWLP